MPARLCIVVTLVLSLVGAADAYPYFQLSTDTDTCNRCHYAPAGGGLLTPWGRDESADTISRGGDGTLLHGVADSPAWLALGGDIRLAALVNQPKTESTVETAFFPMQLDLAARVAIGNWSVIGSAGVNGAARTSERQPDSERREASWAGMLVSREHYVYWRPSSRGPYARVGRFYAPYGLRRVDHTSYGRRYLGFNLLEETYGVSGGWVKSKSEVHATAYFSDPFRWAPRAEVGGAAYIEIRRGSGSYGLSSKIARTDSDTRAMSGLSGKYWSESAAILWMVEFDLVRQSFPDNDLTERWQAVVYAGPVWNPTQGLYLGAAYELFDEDIRSKHVERHGLSGWVSFFPRAHFEIAASARAQYIGEHDRAAMGILQLHYYL